MKTKKTENKTKYALITGATSGIGYELAKKLAGAGFNLIIVARDEKQLKKVSTEFRKFNVTVNPLAVDLFKSGAAKKIYDFTRQLKINIDILVNDAGQGEYGKFIETDLKRQLDIIHLNITSLVSLTYYFMKDMVNRDEGKILQLGSEVSKVPSPMLSVYAATKAFVLSFTEALINELKETNVSMTLLMPGATDTAFFDKARMKNTKTYREGKLESPADVAEDAYKALMKGERRIIASNAKMNVAMAALTPDNINANKMSKAMQPSDKEPGESRQEPKHKASKEEKETVSVSK